MVMKSTPGIRISLFLLTTVSVCGASRNGEPRGMVHQVQVNPPLQQRSLPVTPSNEAVLDGSNVTFTCWTDPAATDPAVQSLQWWEFACNNVSGNQISDGDLVNSSHPHSERYHIVHDEPNQFDLRILDTAIGDGGTYVCMDMTNATTLSNESKAQAELVVLETDPFCISTIRSSMIVREGDFHELDCILNFKGNIAPSMSWTGPQPYVNTSFYYVVRGISGLWSTLSFYANRTHDDKEFACVTNFTSLGFEPNGDAATNIPTYSYLFQTKSLEVQWGPRITHISPDKEYFEVGDAVRCFADAKPTATVQWLFQPDGGDTFVVTELFAGRTTQMQCLAQNYIYLNPYSDRRTFNITVLVSTTVTTDEPPSSTGGDTTTISLPSNLPPTTTTPTAISGACNWVMRTSRILQLFLVPIALLFSFCFRNTIN